MLRGNLATRPFYNERLVTLALILVAVIGFAAAAFIAQQLLELTHQRSTLTARIDGNQKSADAIRADAQRTQRTVDPKHLKLLVAETHEANTLIDQRTFSWTTLLGLIEKTLPLDVRLVAVSPKIDKDNTLVSMIVVSRRDEEALSQFVNALEAGQGNGTFYDVIKHADNHNDDGTWSATIEAYYLPPTPTPAPGGGAKESATADAPAPKAPAKGGQK